MSYRTYAVSHSQADGFQVRFSERSNFKSFVGDVAGWICAATGHHFCNSKILGPMMWWVDKTEKKLGVIPITREVANQISWGGADAWAYLDEVDGANIP